MIIKEILGLIECLEGIEMTNEQLEQFVSKLVMRLSDIESLKISTETVKETVLELKADYGVRHAKTDAKLESIYEIVTKQNSRIYKLEENTTKDREQHLSCPAHAKISVLEQKVMDNKETITEFKINNNARKPLIISIIAVISSVLIGLYNALK